MADTVGKATRSRMMSAVRAKNTKPEMEIRRGLFFMGFRYRLHAKNLPGTPDMLFPKRRAAVFVHGCFWHQHGCHRSSIPATRKAWWKRKLTGNAERDSGAVARLEDLGWRVLIIWECALRSSNTDKKKALEIIVRRAARFLRSRSRYREIPSSSRIHKAHAKARGATI